MPTIDSSNQDYLLTYEESTGEVTYFPKADLIPTPPTSVYGEPFIASTTGSFITNHQGNSYTGFYPDFTGTPFSASADMVHVKVGNPATPGWKANTNVGLVYAKAIFTFNYNSGANHSFFATTSSYVEASIQIGDANFVAKEVGYWTANHQHQIVVEGYGNVSSGQTVSVLLNPYADSGYSQVNFFYNASLEVIPLNHSFI
jgi:hypothetical protein